MPKDKTRLVWMRWLPIVVLFACEAGAAIPENDSFATRTALFGTNVTVAGSNAGASFEPGEPDPSLVGGKSVWWTWTAPTDGSATLSTAGSAFDTMLAVYTGDALTNLTLLGFNDTETNTSTLTLNMAAGTAYQVAVDGALNATGSVVLKLTMGPVITPPVNDDFGNRLTLTGTHLSNITANNAGATREPGEPFHADELGGKSVWWTWTAPVSGALTLSTKNSAIDTLVGIYTGNSVSNLAFVAGNDEDPTSSYGLVSRVTCNVTAGITYQMAVDGFEGEGGFIRLSLDVDSPVLEPANDNFANRIPLNGSVIRTNVSNTGASFETGEPMHLATFGGKSVWWTWTAPSSGSVTLTASNNLVDTILCVYTGSELSNLAFIAGNDEDYLTAVEGDSRLTFNATAGTVYQIAVDGYDGSSGDFTLRLGMAAALPVPSNDNFSKRPTITGTNATVTANNSGATVEPGEPLHNHSYGGKSVWWTWTAPGPGYVNIDTIGSICDTLLAVYTGTSLASLVEVASDDESGGNYTSLVSFTTKSNATYQIAVDGYDGDYGDIIMHVRFIRASYSLTTVTNPAGAGAISVSPAPDQFGKYAPGSVVFLTAVPSGSMVFSNWSGNATSGSNPLAIMMNSNKTITANFYLPPARLSVAQGQTIFSIRTNGFRVLLSGPTNYSYAMERSTNFGIWVPFQTNLVLSNNYPFRDPSASNSPVRAYRSRRL